MKPVVNNESGDGIDPNLLQKIDSALTERTYQHQGDIEYLLGECRKLLVVTKLAQVTGPVVSDTRATDAGMADCMDLFRSDMIRAGVITAATPPMFMSEAILSALNKAHPA